MPRYHPYPQPQHHHLVSMFFFYIVSIRWHAYDIRSMQPHVHAPQPVLFIVARNRPAARLVAAARQELAAGDQGMAFQRLRNVRTPNRPLFTLI
jgi:hypothetical protein